MGLCTRYVIRQLEADLCGEGSIGIWPEMNRNWPVRTAWEYGTNGGSCVPRYESASTSG